MKNKVEFPEMGLTAWASQTTGWLTVQGKDVEYGWPLQSVESPAFVRKAIGLKLRLTHDL